MNEIVFEVSQEADTGFVAECLSESIVTQADTWQELRANVREAVDAYFATEQHAASKSFDKPKPANIRLHLVRDEVLASE
jgi:predicted RNase H-like HicB family nuclease